MHGPVRNNNENASKYCESNHIIPQGEIVETKGTENAGSWDFNIETVTMIFKPQLSNFIYDERFVTIVED